MARNEKTGKKAGTAASKVLRNKSTGKNSKTAAGSALTQRPDRKKRTGDGRGGDFASGGLKLSGGQGNALRRWPIIGMPQSSGAAMLEVEHAIAFALKPLLEPAPALSMQRPVI